MQNSISNNAGLNDLEINRFFCQQPIDQPAAQHWAEKSEEIDLSLNSVLNINVFKELRRKTKTTPKLFSFLKVDKLVGSFKDKLINRSYIWRFDNSHNLIRKIIDEKYILAQSTKKYVFFQKYNIGQVFAKENIFLQIWSFLKTFILLYLLWLFPYQWGFGSWDGFSTWFSIIYLLIDVVLKLNTEVVYQGNIINDRSEIFKHYKQNEFIYDIIFFVSILVIGIAQTDFDDLDTIIILTIFSILICLSLYQKLDEQINKLYQYTNLNNLYREYLNLIRLLLIIVLFCHIFACIWHYVSQLSSLLYETTWLKRLDIEHSSIKTRYIYSFYWAMVTMITVGYGDITPQNEIEVLVCIILMLFSSLIFGFSINQIGNILQNINQQEKQFQQLNKYNSYNLQIISNYMRKYNISTILQDRIRSYLQYEHKEQLSCNMDQINLITENISQNLNDELKKNVFKQIIKKCNILLKHFSEQSLNNVSKKLKQCHFCPNETIYQKGIQDDNSLYFIDQGEIILYDEISNTQIQHLVCGDLFGEFTFFTLQPRCCSAKSLGFSKVFKISRDEFISSLIKSDIEIFHQVKDQLTYQLPTQGVNCSICSDNTHVIAMCSKLRYQTNISRLINNYNKCIQYERRQWIRRQKKLNIWSNFDAILQQQQALGFETEEKSQISEQEETIKQSNSQQLASIDYQSQDLPSAQTNQINTAIIKISQPKQSEQLIPSQPTSIKELHYKSNILIEKQHKEPTINKQKSFKLQTLTTSKNNFEYFDFDKIANYLHYFPSSNAESIITNYNKIGQNKRKSRKSQNIEQKCKPKSQIL